jgi:hypothetical protein
MVTITGDIMLSVRADFLVGAHMSDIFRNVSPAGLARANELNFQAFKRLIGVGLGGEVVEKPGLTLTVTLIPYPCFNGVADAHLTTASAAQAIAEASAYFAARQSPLGVDHRPLDGTGRPERYVPRGRLRGRRSCARDGDGP